ncbi:MAG: alanine racemase [Alphaproteobacteria bacterium]
MPRRLVMSHLACGPEVEFEPGQPRAAGKILGGARGAKGIPASLANSAGIYLDAGYHFDLARPGCALYGIAPLENGANPCAPSPPGRAPSSRSASPAPARR